MVACKEELALLEKWKRKLCLQEWRIKLLTHLHPEEMMVRNTAGCTEWSEAIKTARIEIINPACYGDRIVPFDFENTLVHEVYNWDGVESVVATALAHGNKVVINADW